MLYENESKLSSKTLDIRRVIDSIREELEAVDLYNQRADATNDPTLKEILLHNAKEEKEHASMLLEWLRRNDPQYDELFRENLFKEGPIT
jgi:ferritin-like protein